MRAAARRTAVYPGTFDPPTNGHLDIIARGLVLFDRVIVSILQNPAKEPLFDTAERVRMIEASVRDLGDVKVEVFDGLLVDYAEARGARAILRGVRAVSDFEYEFQMALMNRKLNPRIETVFLMPSEEMIYVSSRLVKEVALLGGDLAGIVPLAIEKRLRERLRPGRKP